MSSFVDILTWSNFVSLPSWAHIIIFMIAKSIFRFTFSNLLFFSTDLRTRLMILAEHALFTFWGWRVLVDVPIELGIDSWMFTTIDCWRKPVFPFAEFHFYYKVKMATHLEDLLVLGYQFFTQQSEKKESRQQTTRQSTIRQQADRNNHASNPAGDKYMVVHHIVTALLCITSYLTTYCKIGSLGTNVFLFSITYPVHNFYMHWFSF